VPNLDTAPSIATAIASLSALDPERAASLDDLVALNIARECVNELFSAYVEELSADPAATPLWAAIASAIELSAPPALRSTRKPHGAPSTASTPQARADARVAKFWDTFAGRFTWDFLPVSFLHALYASWMTESYPREAVFSKPAFSRRLRAAATASGDWVYTRSRPGCLMTAAEPLTDRVPSWSHDGSDAAIYGLRRNRG
jgi:hypothetical protein